MLDCDSSLVIYGLQGSQQIHNLDLEAVENHLNKITLSFSNFYIRYIYHELNGMEYGLSKEGLTMTRGELPYVEIDEVATMETILVVRFVCGSFYFDILNM